MGEYWYNVKEHRVEEAPDLSRAKDRLGPYDTREAAERALDKVEERNEAWEAEDRRFDGKPDPATGSDGGTDATTGDA